MNQQLSNHILEELSTQSKTLLAYLKRNDLLTNDMIEELAKKAGVNTEGDEYKSWVVDEVELNTYINEHGLGSNSINRDDMNEIILKEFGRKKAIKILKNIISEKGVCSFEEFCAQGNIFNDFCKDWKGVARVLANFNNAKARLGSAAIGKYELLIRFLLKESVSPRKGDVAIKNGGSIISMEVKGDAGVLKSQKKDASITVMTEKIFRLMKGDIDSGNQLGFHSQSDEDIYDQVEGLKDALEGGSGGFFRNMATVGVLQNLMNYLSMQPNNTNTYADLFGVLENPDMEGSLFDILARSISLLYGREKDENIIDTVREGLIAVNRNASTNFIKFDKRKGYSINSGKIFDAVGAAQLYEYKLQEGFNRLCIIDQVSSRYYVLPEGILDSCDLIGMLKYCQFGANKADDGRGGSCRIFYRK